MSALPPWAYRGSYIPLPQPIPAILTDPLSAQDAGLCWQDDWTPAIIAALKLLCRPESWTGTDDQVAACMTSANSLIDAIQDGCGGGLFPFTCIGDFTTSASPFSTWSIFSGCPLGTWISSSGYEGTVSDCGGTKYGGVELEVVTGTPFKPSNVQLEYDVTIGSVGDPTDYQSGVYDLDNAHFIGTPVLFSGAVPIGHVVYNSGPSADLTSHLLLFARCSRGLGSSLPILSGEMFVRDCAISGTSTTPPCG